MARRGRPPIGDSAANTNVTLKVTHRQHLDLMQVARENHTTMSGVVRDAVASFIADYREGALPFRHGRR